MQLYKLAVQFFESFMREAGADMADVLPAIAVTHGKDKRSKIRSRAFRRGKSDNYNLLASGSLDLEPVRRANTRDVSACPRAWP